MKLRPSRRQVLAGMLGAIAGGGAAHATTRGRDHFEQTQTDLWLPGIDDAHDGLRIGQLSDVHVGLSTPESRIRAAVERLNEAKPDLVFLTGDYVTHSERPVPQVPLALGGICAPVFVVLGNHDHWVNAPALREGFERLGYTVLQNAHTVTRARGRSLTVLGVDDGRSGHDDVAQTFRGARPDGTRLVLTHAPPTADKLPPDGNLACFSGHTHGGQVAVPKVTEAVMRRAGQPYVAGLYRTSGNNLLYVNRGLGFGRGGFAFRVRSDPELSWFTLRKKAPGGQES